jgi:hypothetical protein
MDLRISESCLGNWICSGRRRCGIARELTSKEKKEFVELRREKRRLETRFEILKRAAAYFDRENVATRPRTRGGVPSMIVLADGRRVVPARTGVSSSADPWIWHGLRDHARSGRPTWCG